MALGVPGKYHFGDHFPLKAPVRRPASKVAFGFFWFCYQLSPPQKYIYTGPIRNVLDVLKSYVSESFISVVYVVRSKILVPP